MRTPAGGEIVSPPPILKKRRKHVNIRLILLSRYYRMKYLFSSSEGREEYLLRSTNLYIKARKRTLSSVFHYQNERFLREEDLRSIPLLSNTVPPHADSVSDQNSFQQSDQPEILQRKNPKEDAAVNTQLTLSPFPSKDGFLNNISLFLTFPEK